jgi:hypothetical protein
VRGTFNINVSIFKVKGAGKMKSFKLMFCFVAFMLLGIFAFAALDVQFVGGIKQTPDPTAVGNEVTFTASFKPAGGAVTNFKIIGGVGEQRLFERVYASIPVDKIKTESFKLTIPNNDHTYIAWFQLDPDKTSGDSNYENNIIKKTISVSGPKKVVNRLGNNIIADIFLDLSATKIYLLSELNSSEVHARSNIGFNCEWKRRGPAPKEDFAIELYVDGVKMPCIHYTCIGHTYNTWARATAKIWIDLAGNHEFKCVINNPTDEEINKSNNTMIKIINIPN